MTVHVVSAQAPYPPRDGGTERSTAFCSAFASLDQVNIYWPTSEFRNSKGSVANGVKQFAVREGVFSSLLRGLYCKVFGDLAWGSSFYFSIRSTHGIKRILKMDLKDGDVVVMEQPWLVRAIPKSEAKFRVILNCHNYEPGLVSSSSMVLRKMIKYIERKAVAASDLVITCTEFDSTTIQMVYNHDKVEVVPNAVFRFELNKLRRKRSSFLFLGSKHPPNVDAARRVIELARILPDYEFCIVGNVCEEILTPTSNVKLLGRVDQGTLERLLGESTAMLNPMTSGSGMHLKTIRAIASGLPIITTEFGARGLNLRHLDSCLMGDSDEFVYLIQLLIKKPSLQNILAREAIASHRNRIYWDQVINPAHILTGKKKSSQTQVRSSLKSSFEIQYEILENNNLLWSIFNKLRPFRRRT
jgi:glycosyltransferase involved in cell wall biosynthesis